MGGCGLLIFYVTNVLFVTKVKKCILPHFAVHCAAFCGRLSPAKSGTFAPNFKAR